MNYKKIYDSLITNAKTRCVNGYTELHHIIPKCMGGDDRNCNLVRLTAREHYIAHALLFKHYKSSKLAHAWFSMLRIGNKQERCFSSKQYADAKKAHSDTLKKSMLGSKNPFYGKHHSKETIEFLRKINKNKKIPENVVKNWVEKVAKKPKSAEHRAKIGRKGFVMLQNRTSLEIIRVLKSDPRALLNEWVNPKKITPEKKVKCKYCDVISTQGNITKWHNENCKRKKNEDN